MPPPSSPLKTLLILSCFLASINGLSETGLESQTSGKEEGNDEFDLQIAQNGLIQRLLELPAKDTDTLVVFCDDGDGSFKDELSGSEQTEALVEALGVRRAHTLEKLKQFIEVKVIDATGMRYQVRKQFSVQKFPSLKVYYKEMKHGLDLHKSDLKSFSKWIEKRYTQKEPQIEKLTEMFERKDRNQTDCFYYSNHENIHPMMSHLSFTYDIGVHRVSDFSSLISLGCFSQSKSEKDRLTMACRFDYQEYVCFKRKMNDLTLYTQIIHFVHEHKERYWTILNQLTVPKLQNLISSKEKSNFPIFLYRYPDSLLHATHSPHISYIGKTLSRLENFIQRHGAHFWVVEKEFQKYDEYGLPDIQPGELMLLTDSKSLFRDHAESSQDSELNSQKVISFYMKAVRSSDLNLRDWFWGVENDGKDWPRAINAEDLSHYVHGIQKNLLIFVHDSEASKEDFERLDEFAHILTTKPDLEVEVRSFNINTNHLVSPLKRRNKGKIVLLLKHDNILFNTGPLIKGIDSEKLLEEVSKRHQENQEALELFQDL